jgi:hypothetical protein
MFQSLLEKETHLCSDKNMSHLLNYNMELQNDILIKQL